MICQLFVIPCINHLRPNYNQILFLRSNGSKMCNIFPLQFRKQSSIIRFIFWIQSPFNTFHNHSFLSFHYLTPRVTHGLLLGLCSLNVVTAPAGSICNSERGNIVLVGIFVMNPKIHTWGLCRKGLRSLVASGLLQSWIKCLVIGYSN